MKPLPSGAGIYQMYWWQRNLRYALAVPEGWQSRADLPLVLALHYAGPSLPFFCREMLLGLVEPALRTLGAIIVAPDCPRRHWQDPRSDQKVLALLDLVGKSYPVQAEQSLVMGYSMGGAGAWWLAGRYPERFAAALPMAAYPPARVLEKPWRMPVYAIHSRKDEIVSFARTEAVVQALQARGDPVTWVALDSISHYDVSGCREALSEAMPWIRAQLRLAGE